MNSHIIIHTVLYRYNFILKVFWTHRNYLEAFAKPVPPFKGFVLGDENVPVISQSKHSSELNGLWGKAEHLLLIKCLNELDAHKIKNAELSFLLKRDFSNRILLSSGWQARENCGVLALWSLCGC